MISLRPLGSDMKYALFLSLAFLMSACQFGEKKKPANPIIEEAAIPRYVDYEINKIDRKIGPCEADANNKKCLLFQIEYPVITGMIAEEAIERINEDIEQEILSNSPIEQQAIGNIDDMISELGNSYQELLNDFEDYEQSWIVEINGDILYQNEGFISLATTVFNYTGGAHPNNNQLYKSYDLQTGAALSLEDLFIEGYQNSLNQSAEIEFRMQKEIPPSNSLESAGYWFEDDRFVLNENFAIINRSLIFYYNPYEIGPYSLGATELELKLSDFADLIDPNGPIGYLKNK